MALPVISTYRLQLRGESSGFAFTFADAENLLDYLNDLGVSHLYLSPIMTAAPGSSHGYDVTDPTTVSPEIGGRDGLARLSAAARERGMGLIVDIVPNHVGIDVPQQNPWWWDVLRNGRSSPYATYFDIDWDLDDDGRIVLPVLGSDDDAADLTVEGDLLRLGDLALPIAPGTAGGTGPEVHDRQHYRLVGWRNGVCGYRRFFSITIQACGPVSSRSHARYPHGSDRPSGWSMRMPSTSPSVNHRPTSAWVASKTARSSWRSPASEVIEKKRRYPHTPLRQPTSR
ncbi:hypothetical protein A9W96_12810 [Mycobacterium sp. 1245852.3]|nr:hypothetical protein A9W96_12810 [Mycobacterium sp. 1245852.3]